MNLTSVYERPDRASLLYVLLGERDETVNISHRAMPSWDEHVRFVESKPYAAWYFIVDGSLVLGACYLSKQDEIGIWIYRAHQGRGLGPEAVKLLMEQHGPRRYLANVNPRNDRSAAMFMNLGFRLCQHTYERL